MEKTRPRKNFRIQFKHIIKLSEIKIHIHKVFYSYLQVKVWFLTIRIIYGTTNFPVAYNKKKTVEKMKNKTIEKLGSVLFQEIRALEDTLSIQVLYDDLNWIILIQIE